MITEFFLNRVLDVMEPFCYTPDPPPMSATERAEHRAWIDDLVKKGRLRDRAEAELNRRQAKTDAISHIQDQPFY